jgi:hypothetical protein
VANLTTLAVDILDSVQVGALSTSAIAALTTAGITTLSGEIVGLNTHQIAALTTAQVAVLTSYSIKALTTQQIAAFETRDVAALTTSQISHLSATQEAALLPGQILALGSNVASLDGSTITPIVLDLDSNGIQTVGQSNGVNFDLNNDGNIDKAGWVGGADGLLVRDISGDGVINHGGELFGEGTVLADGSKAKDGYQALAALDSNLDGLIDANDAAFGSLQVWTDGNGNGITDAGELKSLGSLGITSIALDAVKTSVVDNGNLIGLMGSYTKSDGSVHTAADVWFSVDASGNRTFDLAAAIQQAGSSKVTLSNTQSDTLNVTLSDVLSFGQTDIAGVHQVTIDGSAADTVQLANAGTGWTQTGTVSDGAETYMVYVNGNAQLLINDKIHTVIS